MTRYVYSDAGTGRFVTRTYAEANPKTTVRQTVHPKAKCDDATPTGDN